MSPFYSRWLSLATAQTAGTPDVSDASASRHADFLPTAPLIASAPSGPKGATSDYSKELVIFRIRIRESFA